MKRVLMRMGLVLVALVGVLVVVGLFLPRQWHVERSVVINAPPEHIHPFVDDFKAWRLWAVWDEIDPEAKHEYSPKTAGVGAWWSWNGPTLRHGKMLITRSDVSSGVWIEELDEAGQKVDGHLTTLTWTQEGGGTKVTWMNEGLLRPVIGGYFVWTMDSLADIYFQEALKRLKTLVEKRRAAELEAAQPVHGGVAAPAGP
ncbi:SRPBCC family protein [Archangium minus]|uniref:SRPBCC family protein n=1 Tax=Archangium minus TaxID=83450 RepID=A0ABY9X8I3_9BACT|nr:SRPBCC family protein [Archangium minus]